MSSTGKKKILFIAEGVSMAHPTRLFQIAQTLSPELFDVHFATTRASYAFLDFQNSKIVPYENQSVSNVVFNERLFKTKLPITLQELNQFAADDQKLIDQIQPDAVVTDFRLSYKGIWKKNKIPWFNLIQYHWHPNYNRPEIVPYILPVKIFGRKLVEIFTPIIGPRIIQSQLDIIHQFEAQNNSPLSTSLFDFYSAGDHLLLPDMSEIYDLPQEISNGTFIGPIIWKNSKISWPAQWPQDHWPEAENKKTVYVSMGSTGPQHLNSKIIDVLTSLNYRIYLSDSGAQQKHKFPSNVRHASYLPADLILQKSDLLVNNGGTGTTYHSLSHGVPLFGLASNLDQCLHMDALKRKSLGDYFITDSFSSDKFAQAIQRLNPAKDSTLEIQKTKQQIERYQNENILEKTIRRYI